MAYLPILTLFLGSATPSGGAVYAASAGLSVIAVAGFGLGLVAAMALGLGTKTLGVSVAGLLFGLPLCLVVHTVLAGATHSSSAQRAWRNEHEEISGIAALLVADDRKQLSKVLAMRGIWSKPALACELVRLKIERYSSQLEARPAIHGAEMLLFAELSIQTSLPLEEKQALMFVVLTLLGEREVGNTQFLRKWLELWRQATSSDGTTRTIDGTWRLSEYRRDCSWGNPVAVAELAFATWKDRGIVAWLDAGFTFTPAQFREVLKVVESAEVLERAAASGVDVRAIPPRNPRMAFEPSPLALRADAWSVQLGGSGALEEMVKLATVLASLSTKEARAEACKVFAKNEISRQATLRKPNDPGASLSGIKPEISSRAKTAAALEAALCQG
ncbi:hypothetical protein CY658_23710 [Variovorax sp. RO1]|nr:hypothetical protein CY658_23710 [Variovorax sp. RO1]